MQIGFITYFSQERVQFAKEVGFECLEIKVSKEEILEGRDLKEIKEILDKFGIKISSLACFINHLDPESKKRKENNELFIEVIKRAKELGVYIVTTNAGSDRNRSPKENISLYKEVFSEYAKIAEKEGVKIAIENCPHIEGYPFSIGNIAFNPEMWSLIFETVHSEYIGLEFDPSHLLWQGIDYIQAIYNFANRIYIVHAKDTEILKYNLSRKGIYGDNWWRYRIPGWGDINWQRLISSLYDIGYKGDIIIEHEDPIFEKEKFYQGLRLGFKYLKQFISDGGEME